MTLSNDELRNISGGLEAPTQKHERTVTDCIGGTKDDVSKDEMNPPTGGNPFGK